MFAELFGYEAKRKRLLKKVAPGPLRDFLEVPFPPPETLVDEAPIVAIDFETTGLNPSADHILSVGLVAMQHGDIQLGSAWHQIVNTSCELDEENVVIHQITDTQKNCQGISLEATVETLLRNLRGKIMLVHFARIEKYFLQQACKKLYGMAPDFPIIDTLEIARRRLDRRGYHYPPAALRLFNLREKYLLPRYGAHNALYDALATAELFLAELAELPLEHKPLLKQFLI